MTPQQQSEVERAVARANQAGIVVLAQGHFRDVTCDRFFLTSSSSSASAHHVVRLSGQHLVCDCPASRHGRICVHRAAAHLQLIDEAVRRQVLSVAVESALEAEEQAKEAAGTSSRPVCPTGGVGQL